MSESNKPTELESKEVVSTPWMHVTKKKLALANGSVCEYHIVDMKDGSSIVPIDDKGNTYLVSEYKIAIEQTSTELVSGGIDVGEEPLNAAKRELREELGIVAGEWTYLGCIDPFTNVINSRNHIFLAKQLSFVGSSPEDSESIEAHKMPLKEAVKMALDGKITHGASVTGLLKVARIEKLLEVTDS